MFTTVRVLKGATIRYERILADALLAIPAGLATAFGIYALAWNHQLIVGPLFLIAAGVIVFGFGRVEE